MGICARKGDFPCSKGAKAAGKVFRGEQGQSNHGVAGIFVQKRRENLVKLAYRHIYSLQPADDFADACLDGLGFECGDGDLPGCRLHKLRRGKYILADELVNRADADAEPDRGRVGADCLRMRPFSVIGSATPGRLRRP
jgi:hypothetical protein